MIAKLKHYIMMLIHWVAGRLSNRPDSEHEMSFNRLVFSAVIVIVLLLGQRVENDVNALILMTIFIMFSIALFGHILFNPNISRNRRFIALLLDCSFLSCQLHLGGHYAALFFPIYLWIVFGNGFRFGIEFLAISALVAVFTFSVVVATTPFWHDQIFLSAGLMIGMIMLPSYAGILIHKLSKATKAAEEANKAKSLFLASVSHELRTPLTAIVGMAALLNSERLDPAQKEMVETINVASQSLQSLIRDLLDLSRIEAGQMQNLLEEFDLHGLLIDVGRMFQGQLQAKNLSFNLFIMPHLPRCVRASRQHLLDILLNLVGNAVKFTDTGGITIAVDAERHLMEDDICLKFAVSDTGIGIAPQDQFRIFENFTQANQTISSSFGGIGLGLAIARKLALLLGGDITVESTLGRGSTFRLTVKAKVVGTATFSEPVSDNHLTSAKLMPGFVFQSAPSATTTESGSSKTALRCFRALMVDDNQVNRRVFSRILESAGHDVILAENGDQALDILDREGDSLDIVIMDFNMPELDGLEATKLFRAMSVSDCRLPIVGLTADAAALSDGRWQEAGMDGCLLKPVEPAQFLKTIESTARSAVQNVSLPASTPVIALREHPKFRSADVCALDQTVVSNLKLLGNSDFIDELLMDFLQDASNLLDKIVQSAQCGDSRAFCDYAHALRSSTANIGAQALRDLCIPFVGLRGSELRGIAVELSVRAQEELRRTSEAIALLSSSRRANKA
ncbi:two-component system, sensor histidine kinase RpfC [Acidiphilium sp. MT5]